MTAPETVNEVQAEIADLASQLRSALADLECAESCETGNELRANLAECAETLKVATAELRALVKRANVAVNDGDE